MRFIVGLPLWCAAGKRNAPPHSNSRITNIEQTNRSLSAAQTISSGKVKVDLIFCLVLIKQLLHYLISHNQVKGVISICPPKAFEPWLANLDHKCTSCWSGRGGPSSLVSCSAEKIRRAALKYSDPHCPVPQTWVLLNLNKQYFTLNLKPLCHVNTDIAHYSLLILSCYFQPGITGRTMAVSGEYM